MTELSDFFSCFACMQAASMLQHAHTGEYDKVVLASLRAGSSHKLVGGILCDILLEPDERERARLLGCLARGGYASFNGAHVDGVRECAHGVCVLHNAARCSSAWIGGRMYGWGTLEQGTTATYTGYFVENRFHGSGTLKTAGRVDYKGAFRFGDPHGHGTRYHAGGGYSRGSWIAG
jgi:hypothetical protein